MITTTDKANALATTASRLRKKGIVLLALVALVVLLMLSGCATANSGGRPQATATPATVQQRLLQATRQAFGAVVQQVQVTYDAEQQTVQVTGTLTGAVARTPAQIDAKHEQVKTLCFRVLRVLWTANIPLHTTQVTMLGPVYGDFFDETNEWYGVATLNASTAAQFDWSTLSVDGAWGMYNQALLRADYAPFQQW